MAQDILKIPEEDIRLRSYLIWQHEGCPNGSAMAHWLRAKTELETERRNRFFRPDRPRPAVPPRLAISAPPKRMAAARIGAGGGSPIAARQ